MTSQGISEVVETLTERLGQTLSRGDIVFHGLLLLLVFVILTAWMDGQDVQPPKPRGRQDLRMKSGHHRN